MNGKTGGMQVDTKLVRELAELLNDTGLSEIEVEDGDRKIKVARTINAVAAAPVAVAAPAAAPAPVLPAEAAPAAIPASAVKSPMV
ncbi:MAG: acetyl-CoA carboxylase, biotin carboxyl carrier protein, partial [Sphingomonadales bacterium]